MHTTSFTSKLFFDVDKYQHTGLMRAKFAHFSF